MNLLTKVGLYGVLPAAVLFGAGLCIYTKGQAHGEAVVQKKWDADKRARDAATQKLKDEYAQKEQDHAHDSQKAADALDTATKQYAGDVFTLRADFASRLHDSTTRAGIYQRQAQGGVAECASLASHTAELDRSLEEGRSLVRELRDTLELRDQQLVQVGNQLLADRKLFSDPIDDSTNRQ